MSLLEICQWLENTSVGTGVRESIWWFPILNVVHLVAMAMAAGCICWVDFRLLGFGMKRASVSQVASALIPWTWVGFVLLFITGGLLVLSEAVLLYGNLAARIKLLLLILAGLNVLYFHTGIYRRVSEWDQELVTPPRARLAGAVSLASWLGIMITGRLIPYLE